MNNSFPTYGALINEGYKPRFVEQLISEGLEDFGAVCIEGAKYCGKTWTAQAFASSEANLMSPVGNFQNLEIASIDPDALLIGNHPRLIDEWQEAPQFWDSIRNQVDRSGKKDTFILTGSSIPRRKNASASSLVEPKHSGVGRIEKLRMRPMSLAESGESNGAVSMKALSDGYAPSTQAPQMTLENFCELAVRGGWPATIDKPSARAQRVARRWRACGTNLHTYRVIIRCTRMPIYRKPSAPCYNI